MLHTIDGLGTITLEIELLPDTATDRGLLCRLVSESGHEEPVKLLRSHARLLHHLVMYLIEDRNSDVSEAAQGFRKSETISADITKAWFPIQPQTVPVYAKKVRKSIRDSSTRARRHDSTFEYIDPIEFDARFGIRLNRIPLRIIDHGAPPSTEP